MALNYLAPPAFVNLTYFPLRSETSETVEPLIELANICPPGQLTLQWSVGSTLGMPPWMKAAWTAASRTAPVYGLIRCRIEI